MVTELPNRSRVDPELLSRLQYLRIHADGKVTLFKFSDNYSNSFVSQVAYHQRQFVSSETGCSKLTTSLVNISLNFQKLISQICKYFLLKKCEKLLHCKSFSLIFLTKKFCVFGL